MISNKINVTTGPVQLHPAVLQAISAPPISHRGTEFRYLYEATTTALAEHMNAQQAFLLTGSGTLANEAMMWQIKMTNEKGLILSNGEFGNRLQQQAIRTGLPFVEYTIGWGEEFNIENIRQVMEAHQVKWILFCHCETSTGVVNDLEQISTTASAYGCKMYVDCMSTVGTRPLDLSGVAMATASSGKGLACLPGLAIVFSNVDIIPGNTIPAYLDLDMYQRSNGIPYTISSNLVKALNISIKEKLVPQQYELAQHYAALVYHKLHSFEWQFTGSAGSRVFTLCDSRNESLLNKMDKKGIQLSYESQYLMSRGWCQLALFGYYEEWQLEKLMAAMESCSIISAEALLSQ